ncbi:MAG: hypothetical protein NZ740_08325, partial [Kiritimatiellae bacterium]|nr:hypothetical protein [Kiritimatiellia bacterium]MDW8459100.1 hypothetical protein [Verrucomicrobiota bacterium]
EVFQIQSLIPHLMQIFSSEPVRSDFKFQHKSDMLAEDNGIDSPPIRGMMNSRKSPPSKPESVFFRIRIVSRHA